MGDREVPGGVTEYLQMLSRRQQFGAVLAVILTVKLLFIWMGVFTSFYEPLLNGLVLLAVVLVLAVAAYATWIR